MPTTYLNEIRIEPKGFPQAIKNLGQLTPDLKKAVKETVNKAISFAQVRAIELMLKRYAISRSSLMDQSSRNGRWRFKPKYATNSTLSGGLQVVGSRMPVMRFNVRPDTPPNQRGVPVASRMPVFIETKRGSFQYGKPNVFLARMKSGHIGVYRRKIPNPGGPRRRRSDGQPTQLPITEEYMLSVPEMLSGKELRKELDKDLDKFVRKEFLGQLRQMNLKYWAQAAKELTGGLGDLIEGSVEAIGDIMAGIIEVL